MTRSIMSWLDETIVGPVPIEIWGDRPAWLPDPPTRLTVLAALMAMNYGSTTVTEWGVSTLGGPYGKLGLDQREAIALIQIDHFIHGWMAATDHVEAVAVADRIYKEMARVVALVALVALARAPDGRDGTVP